MKYEIEKRFSAIVSWGIFGVTILVTDRLSTEPANYGKALLLSSLAFATLFFAFTELKSNVKQNKVLFICLIFFSVSLGLSVILSESAITKGLFGTFGRSTGLLTYLSLTIILFQCAQVRYVGTFVAALRALFLTGLINLIISVLNIFGKDIFTWQNPDLKLLGTFGNTNFTGAFLGIFATLCFSMLLMTKLNVISRILIAGISIVNIYAILKTDALQGLVVAGIGLLVNLGFFIKYKESNSLQLSYLISAGAALVLGVLGTLQIGPLARFLYKPSVTLRGEYWQTGINMGLDNPLFGVGLDSYGANFRLYREASAMKFPGANVTTDAAHNVFIDFFAGTGFFGVIAYFAIIILVFVNIVRIWKINDGPDFIGTALVSIWIAYLAQSIISINQIGIAIWGWVSSGLIIGYSALVKESAKPDPKFNLTTFGNLFFPWKFSHSGNRSEREIEVSPKNVLMGMLGLTLGFVICLLPFLNDVKLRNVIEKRNTNLFSLTANNWPQDSIRDYKLIVELARSGKNQEAYDLALDSTSRFPNEFPGWFSLYELTPLNSPMKIELKAKLHEIDPLNPEWK